MYKNPQIKLIHKSYTGGFPNTNEHIVARNKNEVYLIGINTEDGKVIERPIYVKALDGINLEEFCNSDRLTFVITNRAIYLYVPDECGAYEMYRLFNLLKISKWLYVESNSKTYKIIVDPPYHAEKTTDGLKIMFDIKEV